MIMPITVHRPESFGWDETPKEVFRQEPERLIVTRIRRSERELAMFLHEWRGVGSAILETKGQKREK